MRNRARSSLIAVMALASLLAAGCAGSAGYSALPEGPPRSEIARTGGAEPAGAAQVDMDGNAAPQVDPAVAPPPVGRATPVVDPDAPVSSGPVGSGSGTAGSGPVRGGGSAGMDPGVVYPTAPADGAGSSGFTGAASDLPLLDCGEDENVHGEGRSPEARRCLWDAYVSNRPASFRTVAYTEEGDPIAYEVEALRRGHIAVRVDSKDRFGTVGEFVYTCTAMELNDDMGFVLRGCKGARVGAEGGPFVAEGRELHVP